MAARPVKTNGARNSRGLAASRASRRVTAAPTADGSGKDTDPAVGRRRSRMRATTSPDQHEPKQKKHSLIPLAEGATRGGKHSRRSCGGSPKCGRGHHLRQRRCRCACINRATGGARPNDRQKGQISRSTTVLTAQGDGHPRRHPVCKRGESTKIRAGASFIGESRTNDPAVRAVNIAGINRKA